MTMPKPDPMTVSQLLTHLQVVAHIGTPKHLRERHQLPEDLIDAEDVTGLHVDHAFLHGYTIDARGRFRLIQESADA